MGKIKALAIAGLLAVSPQIVQAADFLPPAPAAEPPMLRGSMAPEFSGWYLRGDVGVGINSIRSATSEFLPGKTPNAFGYDSKNLGSSSIFGIGFGYQFNNWFRADLTGEYRGGANYNAVASYFSPIVAPAVANDCSSPVAGRCPDLYNGQVSSTVLMANGYFDLGTWANITPFVGAGVGFASNKASGFTDKAVGNTGGGYSTGSTKTNFAWAGMAGLSYAVSPNLKLELSYRYLDLGTVNSGAIICQPAGVVGCPQENQKLRIASQDLRLGMRWNLSDFGAAQQTYAPAPMVMPAPGPLVRRY